MAYRVCEKCIHRSVCVLHEDDFMSSAEKNGFCSQFKSSDDYAEVKHGRWIDEQLQTVLSVLHDCVIYKCSICGREEKRKEPYCNCGAKMDNGE